MANKKVKENKKEPFQFPKKEEHEIGTEFDRKCSVYRGKILHYMINLEQITEGIIFRHYFGTDEELHAGKQLEYLQRKIDFMSSITSKEQFSFMFKFNALMFILRNYYVEFLDQHPYFSTTFQTLIEYSGAMFTTNSGVMFTTYSGAMFTT